MTNQHRWAPVSAEIHGGDGSALAADTVTSALESITTDHAMIHKGGGFSAYATFAAVANGDTRHVIMTTSATYYVHLKFYDVWCNNAEGTLEIYENPTSVSGGTTVTPANRRRIGTPTVSKEALVHTATLNNAGATLLETLKFGGGGTGPQGRTGGDRSIDIEWVLKPSEEYVFLVTNNSGSAANIAVWLFWYEESSG